ncbi:MULTISPECIES: hypothetical protein [unclassified Pseudomonas]|jgi:outer membrane protein OmpA-like peptidoglycan-associated protein|uniref:hypothetical protein n=1 Tax=unclassified Pseudomonas TaxID=196821 RepID=UPI001304FA9D|nr:MULTISPECIES: hypothetical protein [unclassified Pseudomonas]
MSELLDAVEKHGTLAAKLIVALGIGITWGYCAFIINFFPTGLTLADSLVFIFIALGFGLLYFYWLLFGFLGVYFAHDFTKSSKKMDKAFAVFMCFVFIGCLIIVALLMHDFSPLAAPVFSGALLFLSIIYWKPDAAGATIEQIRQRARMRVATFITALILPIAVAVPVMGLIIGSTFGFIGIAQKDVSLALSEENQKVVSDVAKEFDISVYGCLKSGSQTNIVHHFNILWHGLGERSLVEILAYNGKDWSPKARIELDRSGLKVLKASNKEASFSTCHTLNSDALFDTYEDEVSTSGKQQLITFSSETKQKLEKDHLHILSAKIIGYTDRTPVMKSGDSNAALSLRRAESVHAELESLFIGVPAVPVKSTGQGSLFPKSNCPRNLGSVELKECLAADRRVEIELQLQMKSSSARAQPSTASKSGAWYDAILCKVGFQTCVDKTTPAAVLPATNPPN